RGLRERQELLAQGHIGEVHTQPPDYLWLLRVFRPDLLHLGGQVGDGVSAHVFDQAASRPVDVLPPRDQLASKFARVALHQVLLVEQDPQAAPLPPHLQDVCLAFGFQVWALPSGSCWLLRSCWGRFFHPWTLGASWGDYGRVCRQGPVPIIP